MRVPSFEPTTRLCAPCPTTSPAVFTLCPTPLERGGGCVGRRRRDRLARLPRGRAGALVAAMRTPIVVDANGFLSATLGEPPRSAVRPGREPDGVTSVLAGRAAIVTGGSHGLGLEIARAYVAAGARVLVCARDAAALDRARGELGASRPTRHPSRPPRPTSREPAAVERLVGDALERFSRIDVLVNNAGIYGPKGSIEEVAWDEWEHAMRVNLFGSVLCCRAVLPHFRANGYGKIIQLSGGGATSPLPRLSAYAASKAAIVRFAETLAEELRGHGDRRQRDRPGRAEHAAPRRRCSRPARSASARPSTSARSSSRRAEARRSTSRRASPSSSPPAASDGITGKLISAPWDPWEELADARRRSPRDGRLHTAPHRSGRSRSGVGLGGRTKRRTARVDRQASVDGPLPPFDGGWLVAADSREAFLCGMRATRRSTGPTS